MFNFVNVPDKFTAEFADNGVEYIDPSQFSAFATNLNGRNYTYQDLLDGLDGALAAKQLKSEDFDIQFGKVIPNMGPTTPQCYISSHITGKSYFSGYELWPRGFQVVATEMQNLSK